MGSHSEVVLSAILGFDLERVGCLTGIQVPGVKISQAGRRALKRFLTAAMMVANYRDRLR
jgi:hypothetical protein